MCRANTCARVASSWPSSDAHQFGIRPREDWIQSPTRPQLQNPVRVPQALWETIWPAERNGAEQVRSCPPPNHRTYHPIPVHSSLLLSIFLSSFFLVSYSSLSLILRHRCSYVPLSTQLPLIIMSRSPFCEVNPRVPSRGRPIALPFFVCE